VSAAATVIAIGAVALVLALVALERGGRGAKEIALVATLGAVAAAGRVVFAPIPGVQPVTTICVVTGAALGARAGMAVGAIAGLVSNSFLGQGPWTPPQMTLWALAGLAGAALRLACRRSAIGLAAVCLVWGLAFQWAMNVWFLAAFGPAVSWPAFLAVTGRSLPFDLAHAIGAAAIALAAGPALMRLLERYARRIRVEVVIAPSPAAAPAPAAPGGRPPPEPAPPR
jgi:energy-coupling factor transport system substrate-specific component